MTAVCDDPGALRALAAGKDAIVIGPGMRRDDVGLALVDAALALGIPMVVDADALNQLGAVERLADAAGPVVITPHPGEAGRLLGRGAATIEADRFAAVRMLAARSRATCVLKGARTLICDGTLGDEFVSVNPTGGPALASGGTGDVLAGAIGALLAQGLAPVDAARVGSWVHGEAGTRAGVAHGVRGATATDVVAEIGRILDSLSST
jgi:NAD(P)H-hydrate epimerase